MASASEPSHSRMHQDYPPTQSELAKLREEYEAARRAQQTTSFVGDLQTPTDPNALPYQDRKELMLDMLDPRYAASPSFRASVISRMAKTAPEAIGVILVDRDMTEGTKPDSIPAVAARDHSSAEPYEFVEDMHRDMADPRYQTDASFRARVAARLAASNF